MIRLMRAGPAIRFVFLLVAGLASVIALADSPRNVVFMLGDGMGPAQVKAYRLYADDPQTRLIEPLPMDALLVGAVSTDSIIINCSPGSEKSCVYDPYGFTDSASSATAYATGQDTVVERISQDLAREDMQTMIEAARRRGKSTGMVATSEITHASPAAFASHVEDRELKNDIADQYFDRQWAGFPVVEVLFGGGLKYLQRPDRDLVSEFRQAGYQVALNRDELNKLDGDRLLGLFSPEGMPRAWDRDSQTPSLAEMVAVALPTLNRNEKGFFLFVEGSQVDWASHENSIPGVISEMEEFVAATRTVLDFAAEQGDTLVIITADHETGGLSLGRDDIYRWDPRPLRGMTMTPAGMTEKFLASDQPLSVIVSQSIPFELTKAEIETLDAADRSEVAAFVALATVFNRRTLTGWSSAGHTGVDVPLYVFGPGHDRFHGVMQNEDLGRTLWALFLPEENPVD